MQTPLLHANPHEGSPCSSPLPVQGIRDPRTTPRGGRLALGFPGGDSDTHWGLGHSWVSPDVALSWGGGWGSLEGDRTRSKGMGGVTGDASPRDGAWVPPTDARASHHPLTVPVGRGGSSDLPPPCPTKPRPLSPAPLSPAPPLPTPPPRCSERQHRDTERPHRHRHRHRPSRPVSAGLRGDRRLRPTTGTGTGTGTGWRRRPPAPSGPGPYPVPLSRAGGRGSRPPTRVLDIPPGSR